MNAVTEQGQFINFLIQVIDVNKILISVGQICEAGYTLQFRREGGDIIDGKGNKIPFKRERGVYKMDLWVRKGKEQVSTVTRSCQLQGRLGSLSQHQDCERYACSVCNKFDPLEEEEGEEGEYMGFTRPGAIN